jgi:hypothetical protein
MDAMNESESTSTMNGSLRRRQQAPAARAPSSTHTRSPGESSVYSLSIVFELPPAPAARDELGLSAAGMLFVARRLPARCQRPHPHTRAWEGAHRMAAVAAPGGRATPVFLPGVPGRATAEASESDCVRRQRRARSRGTGRGPWRSRRVRRERSGGR